MNKTVIGVCNLCGGKVSVPTQLRRDFMSCKKQNGSDRLPA